MFDTLRVGEEAELALINFTKIVVPTSKVKPGISTVFAAAPAIVSHTPYKRLG